MERSEKGRGHLKIFFGYAAGVGKTYAMLLAALSAKQRGIDVVAGYVEPHESPKTIFKCPFFFFWHIQQFHKKINKKFRKKEPKFKKI